MQRHRSSSRLALVAALGIAVGGCGMSDRASPPTAPPDAAGRPRNASEIARTLADGRVGYLLHAHRAREGSLAPTLAALPPLGPTLAALHLDPTRDLARAYVSAPQLIGSAAAVLVLEHRVPEARLRQAIDALIAVSGDTAGWERLEAPNSATGLSIARVLVDGEPRALAPVAPDVLVVLPGELAEEAPRFVGTGGAPDPVGPELLLVTLREPKLALAESGLAAFPDSLASLSLTVTLTQNGGADLAVDALSTTPEQALLDAARLTKLVADESAIDLGPVRFTLFDTPTFHADGSRLHADRHLTPAELALLGGVARQLSAGGTLAPEAVMGWVGEASLELVGVVGGLIVGR